MFENFDDRKAASGRHLKQGFHEVLELVRAV